MELGTDKVLAEREGGIGWLVFNRPERRNAISLEMWRAIVTALATYDADPEVRVVVMKGAGERAFTAGADVTEFDEKRADASAGELYKELSEGGRARMSALRKPLVAMIRGFCLGGGLAIAMRADIRIASEDSVFGIPAARLGLSYGIENLKMLTELVGPAYAKEMLFTARRLDAAEAWRIGLVNRVVPVDALEETVRAMATTISENAPLTVEASKLTIDAALKDPQERDMTRLDALAAACLDSADYAEGRRAFREKRKPVFTGR
ncbi:enoyl-CoA hydratase [Propylenella binzhouense]|uniref:Enoyl-CoA hydratase n=1 Tax=Propylenella binzhouense TaxID=2555902 RepID=A0A964WSI1_9HYPH|nr:enoyl-CoA hydratase [Propylenella binzhouense]MYZ46998.1 enoyl-CoA hydratase [Propylenella binzhouense]